MSLKKNVQCYLYTIIELIHFFFCDFQFLFEFLSEFILREFHHVLLSFVLVFVLLLIF